MIFKQNVTDFINVMTNKFVAFNDVLQPVLLSLFHIKYGMRLFFESKIINTTPEKLLSGFSNSSITVQVSELEKNSFFRKPLRQAILHLTVIHSLTLFTHFVFFK
jgi:hypothetical protein